MENPGISQHYSKGRTNCQFIPIIQGPLEAQQQLRPCNELRLWGCSQLIVMRSILRFIVQTVRWGLSTHRDAALVDAVIGLVSSDGHPGGDDVEAHFHVRYAHHTSMSDPKEVHVSPVGLMVMLNDSMVINYIIKYIY